LRRVKWSVILGGWTLFGFFFAGQSYVSNNYFGRPTEWWRILGVWLICSYLWALLTLPTVWLARRFPFDRGRILSSLAVHSLGVALFSLLSLTNYIAVYRLVVGKPSPFNFLPVFQYFFVAEVHFCFLTYLAIVGLTRAHDYYWRYRERELLAAQLETQLAQAQLDALKMQLQPHFLFNTLNTISVLMREDADAANRTLVRLSSFLRATLESTKENEVSLKQELDYLESYLKIEEVRFQDRLTVRLDVDPATLDARVPNLILQPLVENAIRHGIAPRAGAGLLEIRARRNDGLVQVRVRDNGPGLGDRSQEDLRGGIGLSNTQSRLAKLYGPAHRFELRNVEDGGLAVTFAIPFKTGTAATDSAEEGDGKD
jgi:two-component system LytT family sensor kinase